MSRLTQLVPLFVLVIAMQGCSRQSLRLRHSTAPVTSPPTRSSVLPSLPDTTAATVRPLRVSTYNAGLAIGVVPLARERAPRVIDALARLDTDFMCLQELWLDTHWQALVHAASARFPYSLRPQPYRAPSASCTRAELAPAARCVGEHCGGDDKESRLECIIQSCGYLASRLSRECLSCVSRDPLRSFEQVQADCLMTGNKPVPSAASGPTLGTSQGIGVLSRLPLSESDVLDLQSVQQPRAVLYTKLETESLGSVHAFCTHLTPVMHGAPGASGDPEREQARQIEALLAFVERKAPRGQLTLLLGDFNTGPQAPGFVHASQPRHYARFLQAGFENPSLLRNEPTCTFCDDNPVVGRGRKDGVLIDHVLMRDFAGTAHVERILDERIVVEAEGRRIETAYSDHYGLMVTLKR